MQGSRIIGKERPSGRCDFMEVTYHILSETGGRPVNEDSVGMARHGEAYCFTLADGLGGHGSGEIASALAVETLEEVFREFEPEEAETWLTNAFLCAQQNVMEKQKELNNTNGIKTTLTAVVIEEDRFQWAHIGDSRIYLFRRGKCQRRTLDHSVPQMLVSAGEIREKDIRHHPDRNRLLRVIGTEWDSPRFEVGRAFSPSKTDSLLLCSDGFWELIDEKTMERELRKAETVEEWIKAMEREVLRNGEQKEMDNYSAIGIWLR